MCGVVGIYGSDDVAYELYDAMMVLQHRGQDAAGMGVFDGEHLNVHKELGLTRDVFKPHDFEQLKGNIGIGHLRYPTAGGCKIRDAQPFWRTSPYGILFAHNGNLPRYSELRDKLAKEERVLVNSDCDSEVIMHFFAKALSRQTKAAKIKPEDVFGAVKEVFEKVEGGYFVVMYIANQGMIAFRDPNGIRPGIFGKRDTKLVTDYIFASESAALGLLGFDFVSDVKGGEVVFIDNNRQVHRKRVTKKVQKPCIFEYVYFARPDSVMGGASVYKARLHMGKRLSKQVKAANLDIDVVVPVPDTSRSTAIALAHELDIKVRDGLIKNRYIGRTFLMPGQKARQKGIRHKLTPNIPELEGKKVLLVDDSIVRGNTSKQIIELVRQAGAEKVYFASAAPELIHPCLYGIDLPSTKEYIAYGRTHEEVRNAIGADALFYQTLDDLVEAVKFGETDDFCLACFDGKYVTGNVNDELLKKSEMEREEVRTCSNVLANENQSLSQGSQN